MWERGPFYGTLSLPVTLEKEDAMIHLLMGLMLASDASGGIMTSIQGTNARNCFEAAEGGIATITTMAQCDTAFYEALDHKDLVATYVNRGILKLINAEYDSAEADFDRALTLDPR